MTRCPVIRGPTVQTTDIGNRAETAACRYLEAQGFRILDRNWKLHKVCEIDIIADRGGTLYFVEVKYRRTTTAGSGLEYITPDKLRRMRIAAIRWASEHRRYGGYELAAIEVGGPQFTVETFVDSID